MKALNCYLSFKKKKKSRPSFSNFESLFFHFLFGKGPSEIDPNIKK